MEAIKAFVGHSFSKEDEQAVGTVLKYLDTVVELLPNFSWEHAEDPEPRGIDEKVLQRFDGKNLFIGICTRKEQVVSNAKPCWWSRTKHVIAAAENLRWKTSDWIIQEVGLAVGRGMKVILLVEEGVRPPGGIQGVLEYIPMQRNAPEASFTALLAMLATLTPQAPRATPGAANATSMAPRPPNAEDEAVNASGGGLFEPDWKTPQLEWTKSNYGLAVFRAIFLDDAETESLINEKFLASGLASTEESRQRWKAECNFWRLKHGNLSSLEVLKDLGKQKPVDPEVLELLAQAYVDLEEHASAAVEFERASSAAGVTDNKRADLLGRAAIASHRAGHSVQAQAYAERVRQIGSANQDAEHSAVDAIRSLAEVRGETDILIGSMERLLAVSPTDVETRFALAFKYGELDRQDLAAHHYLRIPESARSAIAWNNLGVAFDELGLPLKSVHAYRKAEAGGETLAGSNLANKFLDAGFLPEARKLLEAAAQVADHHGNVDSSLSRAKSTESNEQKKADEALAKVSPVSDFYREFGAAAAKSLGTSLSGTWMGPLCPLDVVQDGDFLTAKGSYLAPLNALSIAVAGSQGLHGLQHAAATLEVKYRGQVQGRVATGTMTIRRIGTALPQAASSLLEGGDSIFVLMRISDDGTKLSVMERSGSAAPRFYDIVRT